MTFGQSHSEYWLIIAFFFGVILPKASTTVNLKNQNLPTPDSRLPTPDSLFP
ncbi:MAG: hypothetical protein F6K56_30700, partial [Moorea sp. SIO3G5]|nr:hypothetical protein [Moorena sp. SIO3G5]